MRIYKEEISPSGKQRVLFGCSDEDIVILCGLAVNAYQHMPVHPDMKESRQRMKSMIKEFNDYLLTRTSKPSYKGRKTKDTPCPHCHSSVRGKEALVKHIKDAHFELKEI